MKLKKKPQHSNIKVLKEVSNTTQINKVEWKVIYPQISICEIWEEKTEDVSSNKSLELAWTWTDLNE